MSDWQPVAGCHVRCRAANLAKYSVPWQSSLDKLDGETSRPAGGTTHSGAFEQRNGPVRAYLINLARSADRRRHMEAQLNKTRLDYELVPAVDGRQLDLSGPELVRPTEPGPRCSPLWVKTYDRPGVAACSLSHLKVYERVVASGAGAALVLEDDVVLAPDIAEVLEALSARLSGAEVALLNFHSDGGCRMNINGRQELTPNRSFAIPVDMASMLSAAGYVITQEACRRMLEKMKPVRAMADEWAFFHSHGAIDRLRCVVPMPIEQCPRFGSTIPYERWALRARLRTRAQELRLPLLQHALAWRRQRIWRKGTRVEFVDEPLVDEPLVDEPLGKELARWLRP